MLEKNKEYVEFTLQTMMATHRPYKNGTEVSMTGMANSYDMLLGSGLDIPCDVVVISKRDFDQLQTENEQLKKKLSEFDFMGWMESAKLWKGRYNDLSKLVGFSSEQEIEDYLVNEPECDTLHEAISKLKDQVKYTCEEWYGANGRNNSWKSAAECNSPKELIEKREALEKEIDAYSRALKEWKEITGYPSPSAVKTALESGASWCHAYNETKEANEKLADDVKSWKNVTGYSTPESYLAARLNNTTPFDYTAAWQAVTGCSCPKDLSKKIVEWEKTLTPHMSARDLCSAMSNAIKSHKSSIEKWQKQTGCDTPDQVKSRIEGLENAIRLTSLTNKNMLREIESTIDEWQTATGCVAPEKAQYKITDLYNRIDKMKEAASIASNWTDKIVEG